MFNMTPEIGIDLGTANILVFLRGKGIVLNEPSVVAIDRSTKRVLAVGEEARLMIGRTPGSIDAIRPLSEGVIADYTTTERMLAHLIAKVCGNRRAFKPRVLICVPSEVTSVERRAVLQAARSAGAGAAMTIEEPMAAAIGAGLPIREPGGNMIVDIGGGTSDIAVISLSGIVLTRSLRIGGNKFDEVIIRHIKTAYNLAIGDRTAEAIKTQIGSAYPMEQETRMEVRGRDLVDGLPKTIEVSSVEIREAISEPILAIVDKVKSILEQTPPELSSDIIERGITLTGGGALLRGVDKLISLATHIPVRVADEPLLCVALGIGMAFDDLDIVRRSNDSVLAHR